MFVYKSNSSLLDPLWSIPENQINSVASTSEFMIQFDNILSTVNTTPRTMNSFILKSRKLAEKYVSPLNMDILFETIKN